MTDEDPNAVARERGKRVGAMQAQLGSNVAMAFFEAGRESSLVAVRAERHVSQTGLKAAFFDGFVAGYWVDVTDQQKSGPYA